MNLTKIGTAQAALVGPGGVGKTTLGLTARAQRFVSADYTVYMTVHVLTIISEDIELYLQTYDVAGQEQFKAMGLNSRLLEGTQAAAVVFDVADLDETLDKLPEWIADLPEAVPKLLVGNKTDLLSEPFDEKELWPLKKAYKFEEVLFTSAKELSSVNTLFTKLAALAVVPRQIELTR
ncbi:MAG: ADP-ribosylation factor-like protein [Candidatus Heimdallarchaeota archaeon]